METTYQVYAIEEIAYPDGEIGGGDMNLIAEYASKQGAMKRAMKESYKEVIYGEKLHEIWMERLNDGDLVEQWAFKNGVMTLHSILT